MPKFTKAFIAVVVMMQVGVIGSLAYSIWLKKSQPAVLGSVSSAPIQEETIVRDASPSGELKHFYEHVPNSTEEDSNPDDGAAVLYTYNAEGFNERFEYAVDKPPNTFRIVTLGDSFTFGQFLSTADNYPETLEDDLNREYTSVCEEWEHFEVINLGVRGYDLGYAVERFIRRGEKYSPDLLIWFVKEDDFNDIKDITQEIEKKYVAMGYKPFNKETKKWESHIMAYKEFLETYSWESIARYQHQRLSLLREHYTGPILFLQFPSSTPVVQKLFNDMVENDTNSFVSDLTVAPADAFGDGHLNEKGTRKVVDLALDSLEKNHLVCD